MRLVRKVLILILVISVSGLSGYGTHVVHAESALGPPARVSASPAQADHISPDIDVDVLLARAVGTGSVDAYDLTADFQGWLTVTVRGTPFTALADGTYRETRKPGELRRRQIQVRHIEVPLLLRPFTGSVRDLIERKADLQSDNPATFSGHDIFVLEEQAGQRYVLAGVHRRIVDDAIDRYGRGAGKSDIAFRRNIARWLYTAPTMRPRIARPGPAYALRTVVDDLGLIYELQLFYDWGQIGSRALYTVVKGRHVWREVTADTRTELSGVGHVEGQMNLTFSNHCLNCKP
jgi:hypothetical protein